MFVVSNSGYFGQKNLRHLKKGSAPHEKQERSMLAGSYKSQSAVKLNFWAACKFFISFVKIAAFTLLFFYHHYVKVNLLRLRFAQMAKNFTSSGICLINCDICMALAIHRL